MTPGAWGRLISAFKKRDYLRAAVFASRKVRLFQIDRALIMECDVRADRPMLLKLRRHERDMAVRPASKEEAPMLDRLFPHHAGKYQERLRRGDLCLLVEQAGATVAMGWVTLDVRDGIEELGCLLELGDATCWGYDTFVLPD